MAITVLDGKRFADMIFQGFHHLSENAKNVDALNVFPVPDGDTGTNMKLTMNSGANEVKNHLQDHIGNVAKALSKGLLMGARGNSGVILSQLFRGFAKAIEEKESLDAMEFAKALNAGVETAYRAVMKPVEGTILTVAKDAAKKAMETAAKEKDLAVVMEKTLLAAKESLSRTPDLLPVLKEVGVVDSGGQGLVYVYEGFLAALKGEKPQGLSNPSAVMEQLVKKEHHKTVQSFMDTEDIQFGYCTEFMVKLEEEKLKAHPFSEEKFRRDLNRFGDSLLVIHDNGFVKVHIHSEQPGEVLSYGQRYGSLTNIKIENMREQHSNIVSSDREAPVPRPAAKPRSEYGIVTVSMGSGIRDLFLSIGAQEVIEGGQTMNPSTEDIAKAVERVNAKTVFILPNNKNIILAAEQAASLFEQQAIVIPTKTVPQGLAALLAFNPAKDAEWNKKAMNEAANKVKSGQVTFAVRDTSIDGISIKKDDYMGILDGKIVVNHKDLLEAAKALLEKMVDGESEILTILTGEQATDEQVEQLENFVGEKYPDVEIEIHNGKQPLYPFIFAVE